MKNLRRVLLVVPRMNIGGAESHVAQVARALKSNGWSVEVASGGGSLAKMLEQEGIRHHWLPIRWGYFFAVWRLKQILENGKFVLVHAHSNAAGPVVAGAVKDLGIPWIYSAHTGLRPPRLESFGEAARILSVSDYNRRAVLERGAVFLNPEKVLALHNAIDCDYFRPENRRNEIRKGWNIAEPIYVVGIVARLLKPERKGHMDLLAVLTRPEAKNWRLAIVGKAHWWYGGTRKVQKMAEKLGVADRVIWVGHQLDVRPALEGSDVIALPSGAESFGLALAEAMAMGKPVVGYAGTGMDEVIGPNEGGFLIPRFDVRALGDSLIELEDPRIRKQMGEMARNRIKRLYDLKPFLEKLICIYEEVIRENKAE